MKTTVKNTAKKVVNTKATTTKVINVIKPEAKPKVEKITYLAIGVTGKQMMKAIYDANNNHKKDLIPTWSFIFLHKVSRTHKLGSSKG